VDLLGRLIDKSLILVTDDETTRRSRMLETVREYAQERLASSGQSAEYQSAHAAVFLALAQAAALQLYGAEQLQWLRRLDVESANFRAAVGWLLGSGDLASVLGLAPALGMFGWILGGSRSSVSGDTCLALCSADSPLRTTAAAIVGTIAYTQGDYAQAYPLLEESVVLARRYGNKPVLGRALLQLGFASPLRGDPRGSARRALLIQRG
jgi:hypothetical protein